MKFKSQLTIAFLVIFSLLVISFTNLPSAQAATQVSGLITSDTTWTKNAGPYNLAGPIGIPSGVTLTIQPGTVVNFNTYYMQINGTLSAKGTTNDKIFLNVQAGKAITFTSSSTTWNEASKTGCIIENAVINSSEWTGDPRIWITDASPKINNCTVLGGEYYYSGLIGVAGGNPIISNNSILSGGVRITGVNNALVINNTFIGELRSGAAISASGNSTIIGNFISTYGLDTGIEINSGYSIIQNNTIMYNKIGIDFQYYSSSLTSQAQLIKFNNLCSNDQNVFMAAGSSTINIANNWWGETSSQAIGQTIFDSKYDYNLGTVTFTPYLTSFNPQAPKAMHLVTFDKTGVPWYISGTILTVDSIAYSYSSFPLTFYWQEGSQHTYAFNSSLTYDQPYHLVSVAGLSNSQSQTLTVIETGSITANYQSYCTIVFDKNGIGSDFAETVLTVDNVNYTASNLPLTFQWQTNSIHNYSYVSKLQVNASTRYLLNNYLSLDSLINISYDRVINASYSTQYLLTINNGGHSTVSPSDESQRWFNKGIYANFYLFDSIVAGPTGTQYEFTGWVGSGPGSYTGADTSQSAVMNGPITETAQWKTEYEVTLATSGLDKTAFGEIVKMGQFGMIGFAGAGTDNPSNSFWLDSGSSLTYSFNQTVSSTESGKRFSLISTTPTSVQPLSGPITITGTYKTQYQVTFFSSPQTGSTTNPSGYNTWQDVGSLSISATPTSGYNFISWTTLGSISITSASSSSTTASISGPGWIIANTAVTSTAANQWYTGNAVPSSTLGVDGDFYLNTANYYIYTKTGGAWTQLLSIQGQPGPAGASGAQGPPGSSGAPGAPGAAGSPGPTGATGATGPKGDKGDTGATGATGPQGPAGPGSGTQGPVGPTGPAGPQGAPGKDGVNGSVLYVGTTAPQNTAGKSGDFYLNTVNGDIYTKSSTSWSLVETIESVPSTSGTGSNTQRGIATLTFTEGNAAVDQTEVTGVKIVINDPSASNGAFAAVSSINYGTSQPPNTGNLNVNGAVFYDVKVAAQSSISQDATVTITLTNNAFTGQDNEVAYWNGANWVIVPATYSSPNMLTVSLPASALTGTPLAVWKTAGNSADPTLLIALAISVVVAVLAVAFVFYSRKARTVKM